MGFPGYPDFHARALTGRSPHSKRPADRPNPFLDHDRTLASDLEIRLRVTSREPESMSVVVDFEFPVALGRAHADEHGSRATVLAHVDQRLLHDACELAADTRRQRQFVDLGDKMRHDTGLLLEPPDEIREVFEIGRAHV